MGDPEGIRCPVCSIPLERFEELVRCTKCRGLWAEHASLAARLELSTDELEQYLADRKLESSERKCPVCDGDCGHAEVGEVVIDVCAEHGVWFDRGEYPLTKLDARFGELLKRK